MMPALSASMLLDVWERGRVQSPLQRALTLLAAAFPDVAPDALAHLPIGQRDVLLFDLREAVFGHRIDGFVTCPACGERLELSFATSDVRVPPCEVPDDALILEQDGYTLRFRLPDSHDLAVIPPDGADVHHVLARCLVEASRADLPVTAVELPEGLVTAMIDRMEAADQQANVELALSCPTCRHAWPGPFDIADYVWTEVDAWAHRTLREVHQLASVYGWYEADILGMSALRRRLYLEMMNE